MGEESVASLNVAQAMIAAWRALDWPRVVSLFAADGVLQIVPLPAYSGRAAIKKHLDQIAAGIERLDFNVKHLKAFGSVVLFERDDQFVYRGRVASVPVVGVLEIDAGHVRAWREYMDLTTMANAMGG
jgi:limonene-1,2-epoxide hydrolase